MGQQQTATVKLDNSQNKFELSFAQKYGAFIFLAILYVGNCAFTNNFFSINTFWLMFMQSFPTILCALGMTLVIASGGIDISVGATMAFAGTLLAELMVNRDMPLLVCFISCLTAALLVGAFNGYIIARFNVQPIVITLITMMVFRGAAQFITGGKPVPLSYMPLNSIANFRFWPQGMPIQLPLAILFALIIAFIARKTVFGKQIEATGDNPQAARLAGINVFWITIAVYAICALMAGVATTMEVGRVSQAEAARMGLNMEMNAIAAVAVGGTSLTGGRARVWGSVAGALIMQLITMTVNMHGLQSSWGMVAKAVVLILAVYLQYDRNKA